jgi:hypothetical protein
MKYLPFVFLAFFFLGSCQQDGTEKTQTTSPSEEQEQPAATTTQPKPISGVSAKADAPPPTRSGRTFDVPSNEEVPADETTKAFGETLAKVLKAGDEAAFAANFLKQEELEAAFDPTNGKVSVEEMWERYQRVFPQFYPMLTRQQDFSVVEFGEVTDSRGKPIRGIEATSFLDKTKCEVTDIHVAFTTPEGEERTLTFKYCVKLPNKPWRIANMPVILR